MTDVAQELDGMRALARALVRGDADDLIQDAAVAALEHPPEDDRPIRPWLATVLRNRKKMIFRADQRRATRELASVIDDDREAAPDAPTAIDRARVLEKVSAALVALEEPYRTAIVRRYLDGETAAVIARELDIPAGTVRWRIKTGLDRLRTALDDTTPRWRRALLPLVPLSKGAVLVKIKAQIVVAIIVLLCLGGGAWFVLHTSPPSSRPTPVVATATKASPKPPRTTVERLANPTAGQARATVATVDAAGGLVAGRVINWSTGEGVVGAEITFASDRGALTVRTIDDGAFELAPLQPTELTLATIAAPGFLPYAPEYEHSTIHVSLADHRAVRGLTVFLSPALDYHGLVVDAARKPVAGVKVKMLGTPEGEQQLDTLATEWTTAADGTFTFHAADEAVFEATRGSQRGWAVLDGNVQNTKNLVITLADAPARDATITGHVVDTDGKPLADVLVRALPSSTGPTTVVRATTFTSSGPDGAFTLDHLDRDVYELLGEAENHAGVRQRANGGDTGITLTLDPGVTVTGTVVSTAGDPVPSFTLTVFRRQGARRGYELSRSIVDPQGHFTVHVAAGEIELIAAAHGWAPSEPQKLDARPGLSPVTIKVSVGGTLVGSIVDSVTHAPIQYARVMLDGRSGGSSAQPSNAGTVTRADGSFELTGLPTGALAVTIGAGEYHPKIEGGMAVEDGKTLGPVTIPITKLAPGEEPTLELVGIGVQLAAVDDGLRVERVFPNGGAAKAGIVTGDLVVLVEGESAIDLGVNGAVSRIRGAAGTTVSLTIKRGDHTIAVTCERKPLKA